MDPSQDADPDRGRPARDRRRRAGRQPAGRRGRRGRGGRRGCAAGRATRAMRFRLCLRRRRPGRRSPRPRIAGRRQRHPAPVAFAGRRAPAGDRRRVLRAWRRRPPVQQRGPRRRVGHPGGLPQGSPVGCRETRVHPGRRVAARGGYRGRPGGRDDLLRPGVPGMGAAGRAGRRRPHRGPGELAGGRPAGRRASRRGDQGAGRGGHQRGVRRGGRPVPGRARRVLDQRLADRRPRRLPAGRSGAGRPGRGADGRLRPAEGQGQEPVRPQRPAGRPPARAVHVGAGQARRGGDRALGGPLRGERHQLPGFPGDHGAHRALGRLVPRMGPYRTAL